MKIEITNTEVYGFASAKWFSDCDVGIRFKNNVFEVNLTMGNQVTKYVGRFKTLDDARIHRKQFLIDLFISNLHKNNIKIENIKEISFIKNYFVCKEGYIINKFGNILKAKTDRGGYKGVIINGKNYLVHRLILREFDPNENYNNLDVNHKNGIKDNNNIANLEWCTRSQNIKHSFKNRLQNNVTNQYGNFKVADDDDIELIKEMYNRGVNQKDISLIVGFSPKTIRKYIKREVI